MELLIMKYEMEIDYLKTQIQMCTLKEGAKEDKLLEKALCLEEVIADLKELIQKSKG